MPDVRCAWVPEGDPLYVAYHDEEWGVPSRDERHLFEMLVLFVRDELAIKNIGKEEGPRYVPYLLTAFFFILFMNLLGLFPWMATATGNLAITCGLAICTFVVSSRPFARVKKATTSFCPSPTEKPVPSG